MIPEYDCRVPATLVAVMNNEGWTTLTNDHLQYHELEDLGGTELIARSNQAADLTKVSHSRRRWRTFLRKRVSSYFSSVVAPSWRSPPSTSDYPIQARIVRSAGSNSRASSNGVRLACSNVNIRSQIRQIGHSRSWHQGFLSVVFRHKPTGTLIPGSTSPFPPV